MGTRRRNVPFISLLIGLSFICCVHDAECQGFRSPIAGNQSVTGDDPGLASKGGVETHQIFKSEYRNGAWTHPSDLLDNISPAESAAWIPVVAMDKNGNAVIAWEQEDVTGTRQIFKSEYRNGVWTHPSDSSDYINPAGSHPALYPDISMDDQGNTIIVWRQSDGTHVQIFKSEYRNGAWTHPSDLTDCISLAAGGGDHPCVAMDNNGNVIIVWLGDDDSGDWQIYRSEYRNGVWIHPSDPSDNISPDGSDAYDPHVAMDDNGNAIISWLQKDGAGQWQIFKSEYRNGVWTHPSNLSDNISPDGTSAGVSPPSVAMDNNGDAVIVWKQVTVTLPEEESRIFKSEYRNGVWTHPIDLSDNISPDGSEVIYGPSVAMDDTGNTIIIWSQWDDLEILQVFKSEYRHGVWTHPSGLSDNISPDGKEAYYADVAMDDNGDAVIVWRQLCSPAAKHQVFKSECRNGLWTHPVDLSDHISPGTTSAYKPRVAMDDNGCAIIVWDQTVVEWYVDDDNTTGPWYGTPDHPFQHIQDGIDAASEAEAVFVNPGTYQENINFQGKALLVKSVGGAHATVIDGGHAQVVVSFNSGEGSGSLLEGFSIMNGLSSGKGGGIYCLGSSPIIRNNIIHDNATIGAGGGISIRNGANPQVVNNILYSNQAGSYGGGIACYNANPDIMNNTLSKNQADYGGGIGCWNASAVVTNTVLWGNTAWQGPEVYSHLSSPVFKYCDVKGGIGGTGNINQDPCFADPWSGDCSLNWLSPCINRGTGEGAPLDDFEGDARPCMGSMDMGADEFTGGHSLETDVFTVSQQTGGTVNFDLDAGSSMGTRKYFVLGSVSGTNPGLSLPGGMVTLPLNWDYYTGQVFRNANTPVFWNFHGMFNATGQTNAQFYTGGPLPPSAVGITMHYAFLCYSPFDFVSNPVAIVTVP